MRKIALALVCFLAACQTTQAPLTTLEFPGRINPITHPIKVPFKEYRIVHHLQAVVHRPDGEITEAKEGDMNVTASVVGDNISITYSAVETRKSIEILVSPELRVIKSNRVYVDAFEGMTEQEAYEFTITGSAIVLPPSGVKTGDIIRSVSDTLYHTPADKRSYIKVKGSAYAKGRQVIVSDFVIYRPVNKTDWMELKGFIVHDASNGSVIAAATNGRHHSGYTVESGEFIK